MSKPQHPDILIRLMHFCASPDMFVREQISGGYVRDMLRDARDEIDRLRAAIRRLAEQDATLSVREGAVTVTMDGTLTDAEREAVEWAILSLQNSSGARVGVAMDNTLAAQKLRKLLERCAAGHQ